MGYGCDTATNGQIACDMVQAKWQEDLKAISVAKDVGEKIVPRHSYNCLLLDVSMDIMDGHVSGIPLDAAHRDLISNAHLVLVSASCLLRHVLASSVATNHMISVYVRL